MRCRAQEVWEATSKKKQGKTAWNQGKMPKIGKKWKIKLKFWYHKIFKYEEICWKEELSHPWGFLLGCVSHPLSKWISCVVIKFTSLDLNPWLYHWIGALWVHIKNKLQLSVRNSTAMTKTHTCQPIRMLDIKVPPPKTKDVLVHHRWPGNFKHSGFSETFKL